MAITLYTIPACPFSDALREQLKQRGAAFTEVDVQARPERLPELAKLTGRRRIVPVLVANLSTGRPIRCSMLR